MRRGVSLNGRVGGGDQPAGLDARAATRRRPWRSAWRPPRSCASATDRCCRSRRTPRSGTARPLPCFIFDDPQAVAFAFRASHAKSESRRSRKRGRVAIALGGATKLGKRQRLDPHRRSNLPWTARLWCWQRGENTTADPRRGPARSPAAPARSPRTGSRARPCSRPASSRPGLPPAARRRPAPPPAGARRRRDRAQPDVAPAAAASADGQGQRRAGIPMPHLRGIDPVPARHLAGAQQEIDGGGGGAGRSAPCDGRRIAKRLAVVSAFRVRLRDRAGG